ncbi:MAG: hydroxyacylglutathione hydrolase C-terminal domain-containing protein [Gammaproteobacteria bacterium]
MNIYSIYQDNSLRNYNYLLVCPDSREAAIIDPLEADRCLKLAQELQVNITTVINTHEHHDHIAGNTDVVNATGAKIIAHYHAPIAHVDQKVHAGDKIVVGKSIQLTVLDTPGHTFTHICLLASGNTPALFCGDTLFNAGCGNTHSGDVELLYTTFTEQLYKLADNTQVYPGHDYLENNLRFALSREPSNSVAAQWLDKAENHDPHQPLVTTLAIEKQINPFFRLESLDMIEQLRKDVPSLAAHPSDREVFIRLRELRNRW